MLQTIGADVEVFAYNPKTKEHKSLCGLIGGTKDKPKQIESLPEGFMVQEDNVSLEWNIPPTISPTRWHSYITTIMGHVDSTLAQMGFLVSTDSSASFNPLELTHPNALVFGCEPDYNAWTKIENKKPQADDKNLRTAGGHIHVGTNVDMIHGIQLMDLYLGVPSIILDDTESSKKRRELYGKAGAMRPKPYGFEYRVLSNFWAFNPELVNWVYNQTRLAMKSKVKFTKAESKLIQDTINSGDKDAAKTIINSYGLTLPTIS